MIGLLLGHHLVGVLGQATRYFGGGLLIAAGGWVFVQTRRDDDVVVVPDDGWSRRLLLAGFALSLDNLVIGLGLGVAKVPLVASVITFGVVSLGLSLAGLEIGRRLALRVRESAEVFAAVLLATVGVLIAIGVL